MGKLRGFDKLRLRFYLHPRECQRNALFGTPKVQQSSLANPQNRSLRKYYLIFGGPKIMPLPSEFHGVNDPKTKKPVSSDAWKRVSYVFWIPVTRVLPQVLGPEGKSAHSQRIEVHPGTTHRRRRIDHVAKEASVELGAGDVFNPDQVVGRAK